MTRHDDHYKDQPIQPIDAMEQVARNAPDHERGLLVAMACKYILRAGTKEDWRKDVEKASNYLYRALHGVWPWDVLDIKAIKNALDNPVQKMCDAEHNIPPRDSGEALVGRECWVWDVQEKRAERLAVYAINMSKNTSYPYKAGKSIYGHAQPIELGHPDPNHPEYRGEAKC